MQKNLATVDSEKKTTKLSDFFGVVPKSKSKERLTETEPDLPSVPPASEAQTINISQPELSSEISDLKALTKEGWLFKEVVDESGLKRWPPYWCFVSDSVFNILQQDFVPSSTPSTPVPTQDNNHIQIPISSIIVDTLPVTMRPNAFRLTTDKGIFIFSSASAKDATEWVAVIRNAKDAQGSEPLVSDFEWYVGNSELFGRV